MTQLLTPLDALDALRDDEGDAPRPDVAELVAQSDGNPMLAHVARLGSELSESEAYDAQILAGLVSP
jgi:hypothetical protein